MVDIITKLSSFNWAAILGSIPPVLTVLFKFTRTPRRRSKLDELVELHDKLPEDLRPRMQKAIDRHLTDYIHDVDRLVRRRLDWGTITSILIVASLSVAILSFMAWLSLVVHWVFWGLFAILAVLSISLLGVGMGQVYKYPEAADA
jgi:nitrate/nitrite-specific signal transduction histidine kinase